MLFNEENLFPAKDFMSIVKSLKREQIKQLIAQSGGADQIAESFQEEINTLTAKIEELEFMLKANKNNLQVHKEVLEIIKSNK